MWKDMICRHWEVEWRDSHTCRCHRCGKFGHWFEEGYAIWTRASRRPEEPQVAEPLPQLATRRAG